MQGDSGDTIAAISTPPGRGGIGIVRVSGQAVPAIAVRICGRRPEPRRAVSARFCNPAGEIVDHGLALYFPAPRSFTGEHVLELHGHGGAVVMDMLLAIVLEAGARLARPGEFSQRAFLNDKMDLAQAEAVADLIDSASRAAALSAQRTLQGEFSRRINEVVDALVALRTYVEGAIDVPEDEIDFLAEGALEERIERIITQLEAVQTAIFEIETYGQSFSDDGTGYTRADLSTLYRREAELKARISLAQGSYSPRTFAKQGGRGL